MGARQGARPWSPTRWVALGLVVSLGASCAAATTSDETDRLRVVASMTIIADFARQVGGEHVEVASLVPVGVDPHTHEPTPSDARTVADADVVLANGAGLEPWFEALTSAGAEEVVWLAEVVSDRVMADDDGRPDPHLWLVPEFAIAYVRALTDAFVDLAPEHADAFHDHAETYVAELRELDTRLASTLEQIPEERRVLVTPHDAYAYFAAVYDFEVASIVGVTTEEEPSAAAVQRVIEEIRTREVPTVFVEATVPRAVIDRVAADAGVEVGRELYGDSVGEPGSGAETYVDMMMANAEALVDGLADR